MAELNTEQKLKMLEIFCPDFNRMHNLSFSPDHLCEKFKREILDIDIRLCAHGMILDIQVVRAFGNSDLEYKKDDIRNRIEKALANCFLKEKIKGYFFWDMNEYPSKSQLPEFSSACVKYIKKEIIDGVREINFERFQRNGPREWKLKFRDFEFKKGEKWNHGFGYSENSIDSAQQFFNALKKKQELLDSELKKQFASTMVLLIHFERSAIDDFYLNIVKESLKDKL